MRQPPSTTSTTQPASNRACSARNLHFLERHGLSRLPTAFILVSLTLAAGLLFSSQPVATAKVGLNPFHDPGIGRRWAPGSVKRWFVSCFVGGRRLQLVGPLVSTYKLTRHRPFMALFFCFLLQSVNPSIFHLPVSYSSVFFPSRLSRLGLFHFISYRHYALSSW